MTEFFRNLELLTPEWEALLLSPAPGHWQPEHLAMARYLVERYWLQAVSDYDLYCRSMQKLVDLKPGMVYTAHTEPYSHGAASQAAEEAIEFAGKILADVNEYLQLHGDDIRVGEAARYVCEKEGKKWGCGACVCVLNHLKRLQNPEVEKQVDFTKYLYGM